MYIFRCNITQCDSVSSQYWEPWLNFTIPQKDDQYEKCNQYAYRPIEGNYLSRSPQDCIEVNFNMSSIEKCYEGYKFRDKEYTVANEVRRFKIFLN